MPMNFDETNFFILSNNSEYDLKVENSLASTS